MIGHYLLTALAQFRKAPFSTAANILTLALGLTCMIAALGIAAYWSSADDYHPDADRIFVVGQGFNPKGAGGPIPVQAFASAAPAPYLAQDFPQIERIVRVHSGLNTAVVAEGRKLLLDAAYAEPGFLSFFDFDFIAGDARSALSRPGSVVLTRSTAERLFGDVPALGKRLLLHGVEATVTGVIAPVRQPSFMGERGEAALEFDVLGDWSLSPSAADFDKNQQWFSTQGMTFIQLKPGASPGALNAQMPAFVARHMPAHQSEITGIQLQIFPLGQIGARNLDNALFSTNGLKLTTVGVLIGLGGLILLVAVVNYANLATAQAVLRTKQIGLRKVLGAGPVEVMTQSWLASLVQTLLALAVALITLAAAAPALKSETGIDILFFLSKGAPAWLLLAGLVLAVVLAAGAYPALAMSRIRPAQALQSGRSQTGSGLVARILVGVQFGAAGFLLILLAVSHMQRSHLEAVALAPRTDPIIVLNEVQSIDVDGEALVAALKKLPGVKEATIAERAPWTPDVSLIPLVRSLEAGASEYSTFAKHVGHDYFATMGFKLLAGRTFDRAHETVTRSITTPDPRQPIPIVIDEALSRSFGFPTPQAAVGQTVYAPVSIMRLVEAAAAAQPMQVVGVIETDTTWMGADIARGSVFLYGPDSPFGNGLRPIIRLAPEDVRGTVAGITRIWNGFAPTTPLDLRFFDQMFEASYRQYGRIAQLFNLLANIALVIAALGLLGMAVHVAARRRHEIAIRKTLGSSTLEAVGLLLADFSKPVIVANLIVWPLGYLAAEAYLSTFAYRVDLSPWPFVLSLAASLAIAWLVVAGQTFKVARVSPAQALRDQ